MKKLIIPLICLLILGVTIYKLDDITSYLANTITNYHHLVIKEDNDYKKDYGFKFVNISKDYNPYSKQDLKDLIYSILNNGWDQFTFYCPSEYTECINDMRDITNDKVLMAHINNYVHPYNSYDSMRTSIMDTGEITIYINKLYTQKEIEEINQKVEELISRNYKESDDTYTNLKRIHDDIINNTKYDVERNNNGDSKYLSYMAYGPAIEGYATCNGYADYMAIILDRLGIKNFKVATTQDNISYKSNGHIWNAVYLDNKWVHLDLTWDDPVSTDGKDYLYHKYFLVSTEEMKKADDGNVKLEEHNFNQSIYLEFKES